MELEGARPRAAAAVGPILDELEGFGVIERVPDPADGRARIVRLTEGGRAGLLAGFGLLAEIEAELSERVGVETIARLKVDLVAVLPEIERLAAAMAEDDARGP